MISQNRGNELPSHAARLLNDVNGINGFYVIPQNRGNELPSHAARLLNDVNGIKFEGNICVNDVNAVRL